MIATPLRSGLLSSPNGKLSSNNRPCKEPRLWRVLRLSIALPLLALSFGAFLPLSVVPVSSQAVVNARLARLRAPMPGDILETTFETGDVVKANQVLTRIRTPRASIEAALGEPLRNQHEVEAQLGQVESQLEATRQQLERYGRFLSDYTSRLAGQLSLRIQGAEHDRDSALGNSERLSLLAKRDEDAEHAHLIPKVIVEQAREKANLARADAESKATNVAHLQKELNDVEAGFFLMGLVDQPRYLGLRDEAQSEVDKQTRQKESLERRLQSLKASIAAQKGVLEQITSVKAPVEGIVWSRSIATGQNVGEGDDLFRIADASSVHVDVWLDRRYGPQLSIGDAALINLNGLGKEIAGRITAFQGTSRRRLDEEINAIDLQPVHPDQYRVTIELDPVNRNPLYIGQAARVLFPGAKSHLKAKLYSWLARL